LTGNNTSGCTKHQTKNLEMIAHDRPLNYGTDRSSRNVREELHYMLRNIPEEPRTRLLCGEIFKSRTIT